VASFVQSHVQDSNKASSATNLRVRIGPSGVTARNLLVAWICFDNTSSTAPTVSSIAKPAGETASWAQVGTHNSSTATAAAGVRGAIWAIKTTIAWPPSTDYTITLSAAVVAKASGAAEYNQAGASLRGTAGTGTSAAGTPSAATSGTALVAGDLVLGLGSFEDATAPTGDADTTNGSWVNAFTPFATTGGVTTTNVALIGQHKLVTATGVQTYNPTRASDSGAAVVGLIPVVETFITGTQTASGTGAANDATISTVSAADVNAQPALGTGAANDATVVVAQPFLVRLSAVGGPDRLRQSSPSNYEGLPDAIVARSNLDTISPVTELWNPPATNDGFWIGAVDPTVATDLRVSFYDLAIPPATSNRIKFQVEVRKTAVVGAASPTVTLELWEAGSFVATLASGVAVTSTTSQVIEAMMDPGLLADPSGADVQLRVRGVP
jgi:hypothetical protein